MSTCKLLTLFCVSTVLAAQEHSTGLRESAQPYLEQALAAGERFVNVSSASGTPALAPGSLATAFGTGLAAQTVTGTVPFGTSLGGVSVQVIDSAGVAALAPIFYVSPSQINYEIPASAATGQATVNVVSGTGNAISGTAQLLGVAPSLFTANGNGMGVVAATAYRQTIPTTLAVLVPVFACPSGAGSCVSVPIDTGLDQPVTLTVYATGLRSLNGQPGAVTVTINGQQFPARVVAASADTSPTAGIDEVSIGLPLSLRGSGEVNISITAGMLASNSGTVQIR